MSHQRERRILSIIVRRLERPDVVLAWASRLTAIAWLLLFSAYLLLASLLLELLSPAVLAIIAVAVLLATMAGWLLLYRNALRDWPMVRSYIDEGRVRKRLADLTA